MSDNVMEFFKNDRFAAANDIRLVEVSPGHAVAEMQITDRHLNALDTVQGGATFTLADLAFAAATNSRGSVAVGINCSITYFKPPKGKRLTAVADEISSGKTLCTCNVDIFDDDGTHVAHFTGNGFIKK